MIRPARTPTQLRSRIKSQESYRGARIERLWKDWQPEHRSGDAAINDSYDMLLRRVRELGRDDATIKAAKRAISKHVIGCGILAFADSLSQGSFDEYDDAFNDPSDDVYTRWSEERECDIEGRFSVEEMQQHQWNEMMESGESLWLRVSDDRPGRSMPLAYQMLESEQIDTTQEWDAGDGGQRYRCRRGIEYDGVGRPVAYWIYDAHPHDDTFIYSGPGDSTRVPAERVTHTFMPNRTSEHRGVTWFTNLQSAKDLDWYVGNELTAAALGALFTVAIKREHGQGSGTGFINSGAAASTSGNSEMRLGKGIIADLGPNDSIEQIESKRPNRDAKPFIDLILMLQGMSVGVSRLRLTGDYSESSYTSARGAHLDDQAFFSVLQMFAEGNFVRPIRKAVQREAVALGLIPGMTPTKYRAEQYRLERFALQSPGREQLDPEAETAAAVARIRSGLSTYHEEAGKRGYHWRKIARQRAREVKFWEQTLGHQPDLGETAAWLTLRGERQEAAKQAAATTNRSNADA